MKAIVTKYTHLPAVEMSRFLDENILQDAKILRHKHRCSALVVAVRLAVFLRPLAQLQR